MNLIGMDAAALEGFFAAQGEKPFRARQLLHWIHQRGESDFARMSDLAKGLRDKLATQARIEPPLIVGDTTAEDGTRKWLLKVDDANAVHGSDSVEYARTEMAYFFPACEVYGR